MRLFRSTRHRRIDRALSSVIDRIENDYEHKTYDVERTLTWRELDILGAERSKAISAAYERADKLARIWQARVEREEITLGVKRNGERRQED